tara:strand:- start:4650 stop:4895 length:246 start_codon:yes stop_codon:yes gene_type:complete
MIKAADINEVMATTLPFMPQFNDTPICQSPECFIGSYAPITPPGQMGPFFVNTYFLQGDRKRELAGPVQIRSNNMCSKRFI